MDDSNLDVYPGGSDESPEAYNQCFFDPDFPDQEALKSIVRRHGQILFQPFDQEGLRVESLHLEVDPIAQFRMQPRRFIRSDILAPLKALIDQFVSEGVLVSDISCTTQVPWSLFIRRKVESGWRWIIGRSINICVYQPTSFPTKTCYFSSSQACNTSPKSITYGVSSATTG